MAIKCFSQTIFIEIANLILIEPSGQSLSLFLLLPKYFYQWAYRATCACCEFTENVEIMA